MQKWVERYKKYEKTNKKLEKYEQQKKKQKSNTIMHETHNVSTNLLSQAFRFMFLECLTRSALNGMVSPLYSALVTKDRRASNFTDFRKFQSIFRILQYFRSFFSHVFCSFRQEQKATTQQTVLN